MPFPKGHVPWNKGKPWSQDTKRKMSEVHKGKAPWNKGKKETQVPWNKGLTKNTSPSLKRISEQRTGGGNPAYGKPPWNKGMNLSEKHKQKLSESHKGNPGWFKGKKLSEEHKQKLSEAHLGHIPWNKGLYGVMPSGKDHPRWRGLMLLNHSIRISAKYTNWREQVFARDDYTCKVCRKRGGGVLHADHHPKMFFELLEDNQIMSLEDAYECKELWDVNNGRTLCKSCHGKSHRKASASVN